MKVLHSAAPMSPKDGGVYAALRDLTAAAEACRVKNEVLMPYQPEASAHLGSWAPVSATCHGRVTFPPLQWSSDFARRVRDSDSDILHTHGIWQHPSIVALDWKKSGRPHVASVHGMLEPWAWQHHAWKKRPVWHVWERRNLQSASLLHATSEQEAMSIRARGLTAPIAIIPNGVKLPTDASRNRKVESQGSDDPHERIALFLSRVHPKKGLPMLLDAWAKVKPEGWRLKIAGPDEGRHRRELEGQVKSLGLAGNVEFLGPLAGEPKETVFREADLFVLPTHSENFGIVVAEAMARGLPVITTHGAPWEVLETDRCGWWVPVSAEGIASALDDATHRSPAQLQEMGARGRDVVAERFAWERIAREFIDCYQWTLGNGPKPDCVV